MSPNKTITEVKINSKRKFKRKPLKRVFHKKAPRMNKGLGRTRKRAQKGKSGQLKRLKKELWELCKQITRKRYGNTCYTCGAANLSGGNWHTAHFIASSICGLYLRYDLRNLRPCCYRCNVSLAGNGAMYFHRMLQLEGQEYIDKIFADKNRPAKATVEFFAEKIAAYKALLQELEGKK